MVTLPPPTAPVPLPAQLPPQVNIPLALETQQVSAAIAALQQKVVLAVLSVQADVQRQLLNITTPQGPVTLKLPDASQQLTLPNRQPIPVQAFLGQTLPALPLPDIRTGAFLQLEPLPNQLPAARLLLAPDLLALRAPPLTTPHSALQTPVLPNAPSTSFRTTAYPLPPGSIPVHTPPTGSDPVLRNLPAVAAPLNLIQRLLNTFRPDTTQPAPAKMATPMPVQQSPTEQMPAQQTASRPLPAQQPAMQPNNASFMTSYSAPRPVEVFTTPQLNTQPTTVIGATPRGDAVVRLPTGEAVSLAHTRLPIMPTPTQPAVLYIRPIPTTESPDTIAPRATETRLPALQATLDLLQTANPLLASRVAAQTQLPLPTGNAAQVASTLLFFLSAMSGGTYALPQAALHPVLQNILDRLGPRNMASDLTDELKSLTRLIPDSLGLEWRGYQLPTPPQTPQLYGPVWLYVQQRPDEQSGSKPEGAASGGVRQTRFLIDLELSRIGHTQLEGIAKHNHIDLKLNTPSALPQDLQRELV
ncbi:MAG: hypothetical protein AB7G06_03670, partial [Bdellovibrionales bacterium]